MAILYPFGNIFAREIGSLHTSVEGVQSEIYRVATVVDGGYELLNAAGRGKYFVIFQSSLPCDRTKLEFGLCNYYLTQSRAALFGNGFERLARLFFDVFILQSSVIVAERDGNGNALFACAELLSAIYVEQFSRFY